MKHVLALICVALAFATAALAANRATLTVPASKVGDTFTVSGCGYKTGHDIFVYLYKAGDPAELVGLATHTDSQGCFNAATGYTFTTAGTYETYSYQIKPGTGPGSYNQNHPTVDLDFSVT